MAVTAQRRNAVPWCRHVLGLVRAVSSLGGDHMPRGYRLLAGGVRARQVALSVQLFCTTILYRIGMEQGQRLDRRRWAPASLEALAEDGPAAVAVEPVLHGYAAACI